MLNIFNSVVSSRADFIKSVLECTSRLPFYLTADLGGVGEGLE